MRSPWEAAPMGQPRPCPSVPSPAHPLTQPLVTVPPGGQVQRGECVTADKVPRERVGHEDVVLGHGGDARVVADDSGQGDPGQRLLLLPTEHARVLPPEPAWGHPQTLHPGCPWPGGRPLAPAAPGRKRTTTDTRSTAQGLWALRQPRGFHTGDALSQRGGRAAQCPGSAPTLAASEAPLTLHRELGPHSLMEPCAPARGHVHGGAENLAVGL